MTQTRYLRVSPTICTGRKIWPEILKMSAIPQRGKAGLYNVLIMEEKTDHPGGRARGFHQVRV